MQYEQDTGKACHEFSDLYKDKYCPAFRDRICVCHAHSSCFFERHEHRDTDAHIHCHHDKYRDTDAYRHGCAYSFVYGYASNGFIHRDADSHAHCRCCYGFIHGNRANKRHSNDDSHSHTHADASCNMRGKNNGPGQLHEEYDCRR